MTSGEVRRGDSAMEGDSIGGIEAARALPPFDRMSIAEARAALRPARPLLLRKGKALFYQGDRVDSAHLLVSGSLRGLMYRSDESTIETGRSMRGEWLGLAEMFLDSPSLNDEIAEESSTLLSYSRSAFDELLQRASLTRFFLQEMARGYYVLHSRIGQNRPLDRLVHYLLSEDAQANHDGPLVCRTQEEIAAAIGLSRETVNKHLRLLQRQGVISVGRAEITILDAAALRENAE